MSGSPYMMISSVEDTDFFYLQTGSIFGRVSGQWIGYRKGQTRIKSKKSKIASFDVDGCSFSESYNLLLQLGGLHGSKKGNTLPFFLTALFDFWSNPGSRSESETLENNRGKQ
jgi:hypothetical protein